MKENLPIIEFHILQSFPVSCLNRDDIGSPKSCIIGGVPRARVSSQCWKRAVRQELHQFGIQLGIRTKKIVDILKSELLKRCQDEKSAEACANQIGKALSDDSLIFLTDIEYQALCDYAESKGFKAESCNPKEVVKLIKKAQATPYNGLDIGLFGRMVAKAPSMNVEAAASFSHTFSTHEVSPELDFFTALDDFQEETESAHLGTTEFNSATYYRYISLNLNQLADTLGTENKADLRPAVEAFVKALYLAVPAARQATMSASCGWNFARIYVRHGQRVQCDFEKPVPMAKKGGYLEESIKALKAATDHKEKMFGSLFGKVAEFDFGENDESIDQLIEDIVKAAL